MCTLSHTEAYSRTVFPYGSYLIGHFEEYKDPGHFVGKGWMELRFDRLMIQPDTNVPINARVVAVPKYPVDSEGRIHGTGHPVRDTIEWLIPVLWPIDLINLPRRGPRPTLKPETQLTLKVLDDFGIPSQAEQDYQQPALIERRTAAIEQHKENMVDQGYMTADEAFGQQCSATAAAVCSCAVQQVRPTAVRTAAAVCAPVTRRMPHRNRRLLWCSRTADGICAAALSMCSSRCTTLRRHRCITTVRGTRPY